METLTTSHNGDNDAEVERVRKAHPGEPECVIERRVLGALAPTRCASNFSHFLICSRHQLTSHLFFIFYIIFLLTGLGDIPFKQPPSFTRRILYNLFPGFHNTSPWEEFLVRNRTPPYIIASPEIVHRRLDRNSLDTSQRYLILASDGFIDLCSGEGQKRVVESWARGMAAHDPSEGITDAEPGSRRDNMALRLLRRALGGEDRFGVSRVLTLDMDVAWIDDTSIVVQPL